MTENAGVPTGIPGVQIGDTDQEILRFDSIIRTGLSPRIRHSTRAIALERGGYVLIIRAERSWYGPHRVTYKEDSRFYGRTTNGKYPLDVTDLRNAFLFSNTITEKLLAFRSERIIALASGQTLAPLGKGPMLVIHCLPLESFSGKSQFDVLALRDIKPLGAARLAGYGSRVNFEGRICVAHSSDDASAYTQVFRNGAIEAVRVGILNSSTKPRRIPSTATG